MKVLLESDIVRPSKSPYNSPLWIVPKKPDAQGNKRWRMVIDFPALNEKSISDAYFLFSIFKILDQLESAKYFSVFNLANGYNLPDRNGGKGRRENGDINALRTL